MKNTLKYRFLLCLLGVVFALNAMGIETDFNILHYGASRDTTTSNTDAINRAIDACFAQGGGRVVIPAGKFKAGTIVLKSNVELHLSSGAVLFAGDDKEFVIQPRATYRSLKDEGGWVSMIYAVDACNIAITGSGTIDGCGKGRKGIIPGGGGDRDGRPRNILLISCKNVRVCGVTMRNSAMWNQHYLDCEDVTVDNIKVFNHCNGNNDGIDIDGCRRFILSNSVIDSDDDGIVLKSTGVAPCEDVIINNCIVSSFANAIKCGTESTGGFKNIVISNCIVKPSRHKGDRIIKSTPTGITAISLEVVDGGVMDGVLVSDIVIEGTECPLYIRLANRARKHLEEAPLPSVGVMRNIQITNILAYNTGNFCSSITGVENGRIENVKLSNLNFTSRGGLLEGSFRDKNVVEKRRHDVSGNIYANLYWENYRDVCEDEKGYPQPTVWGNLPSSGLFIRHVGEIVLDNVSFKAVGNEPRTPIVVVDVDDLTINKMSTTSANDVDVWMHQVKSHTTTDGLRLKIDY